MASLGAGRGRGLSPIADIIAAANGVGMAGYRCSRSPVYIRQSASGLRALR